MAEPRCEWHEYPSGAALAEDLAATVAARLGEALDERARALLAVSGGRTPAAVFKALSRSRIDWSRVSVTLVDERFVPTSSTRSNARLVTQNLLQNRAARAEFIGLYTDSETVEEAAGKASEALSSLPLPPDVALVGMGTDQHTASFFPDAAGIESMLCMREGPTVLPVEAPSAGEPRLTLSMPVLAAARFLALHIEGEEKRQALEAALGSSGAPKPPIAALFERAAKPVHIYWAPKTPDEDTTP